MTATNKPMTGAQLDELMAVTMRMQSDSEKMGDRSVSMFAYAVQVAVLEIRETRCKYEELQSQNADLAVQLANAESKCRELAAENAGLKAALRPSDIPSEWTDAFGDTAVIEHDATGDNQGHSVSWSWVGNQEEVIKSVLLAVDGSIKTPATDALLAEVRAQAQSEVIEWLDAEITAIDTMYRGDPSYEHDAYWMKSNVLDVVELARKAFAAQSCAHCGGIGTCSEHGCTATDQMIEQYRASQEAAQ